MWLFLDKHIMPKRASLAASSTLLWREQVGRSIGQVNPEISDILISPRCGSIPTKKQQGGCCMVLAVPQQVAERYKAPVHHRQAVVLGLFSAGRRVHGDH